MALKGKHLLDTSSYTSSDSTYSETSSETSDKEHSERGHTSRQDKTAGPKGVLIKRFHCTKREFHNKSRTERKRENHREVCRSPLAKYCRFKFLWIRGHIHYSGAVMYFQTKP